MGLFEGMTDEELFKLKEELDKIIVEKRENREHLR